jgi:hypothetical protein
MPIPRPRIGHTEAAQLRVMLILVPISRRGVRARSKTPSTPISSVSIRMNVG